LGYLSPFPSLRGNKPKLMPGFTSKEQEIVAYDYFTDLKHSSYYNIYNAASLLGIPPKDIYKENTFNASHHYCYL
jgi:hypothetical protein